MSLSPPPGNRLDQLLEDLETASKAPAKRRQTSIKPTVEKTTSLLYDKGALPDDLIRLVDLITQHNHLDQASLSAITRNLYPLGKINDEVILRIIGALGHGHLKPSFPLQGLFLKWLVMVYHLLQNPAILSQTYGVLFNLLDTAAIRPQLCHLLALITRRRHVRPFRIQTILALSRQTGGDPNLTGLLRVFKNYYPEIIVGDITKGRAAAFKHPDTQWRERLNEIQQQHLDRQEDDGTRNGFTVNHALGRRLKGARALVPGVHTLHAQETSVTLEEFDSAERFVNNLEKIEMPSQLVAVLADPLLQKFLLLRPSEEATQRISNWLMACVGEVACGDTPPSLLLDMVEVIHDYVLSTKELSPILVEFFRNFLQTWNGLDKQGMVLETLSFMPPADFAVLSPLFQLLQSRLLNNTPDSQLSLLKFYTQLLRNWTTKLLPLPPSDLSSQPVNCFPDLITHVNPLCLTLTQSFPSLSTSLVLLDFYTTACKVYSSPTLLQHIPIAIPPPLLVYNLAFSPSLTVLSRLCSILTVYKVAWETVITKKANTNTQRKPSPEEWASINTFNGFLMDICNNLWRGRAFALPVEGAGSTGSDTNARGCRVPRSLLPVLDSYLKSLDDDLKLEMVFGLSYNPVLCLQSINFVRSLEEKDIQKGDLLVRHAGPVTQGSLQKLVGRGGLRLSWQEYRAGVLRWLEEEQGQRGLPELMYNTMKNLMRARRATEAGGWSSFSSQA
ncbi:Mis6-domain-containing protein [Triangularia verruculosa]|uniref:Mis6-domain-containing protein n=1 Tax=Triangularia verruculosa TaxID=2587418 RepID=A0AAN6XP65_9PEZI|nr:Mis6-domain-containing protein [Triangularia verruculosa]